VSAPASLLVLASAIRDVDETEPLGVSIQLGTTLPSAANLREHHLARAKRVKKWRSVGWWALSVAMGLRAKSGPLVLLLTRVAPRPLDDDNLASAFKAFRDGVADVLGVDDRDPRVTWLYAQRKGPAAVELGVWRRR